MKKIIIIISVIVAALIAIWYFKPEPSVAPRERKNIYNFDPSVCPGEVISFAMSDPYMRGIIEEQQVVEITLNWYACNNVEADDIVLYRFSEFNDPVIRRVVGKPGDKFALTSQPGAGWFLKVNGKIIKGVNGPYYFGDPTVPPPLGLAEVQKKGIIGKTELIVLSSFGPGEKDSGVFGMLSVTDIIGKVTASTAQEPEKKPEPKTKTNN